VVFRFVFTLGGRRNPGSETLAGSAESTSASMQHRYLRGDTMSGSDQLSKLATQAKQAEDNIGRAKDETQAELQTRVNRVKESSEKQAAAFKASTGGAKAKASQRWEDVQQSWNAHIAEIREHGDGAKAEHDVKRAEHRAERREDNAVAAVAYAVAVLEEAEYAVLDALLAREEADAMVAAA
jgi:hypothetical protein